MLNRRLLMAQTGSEPPSGGIVQDGLVLWLDGTDRGGVPGTWIDKISGVIFTLYGVTEHEKYVDFSGAGGTYGEAKAVPGLVPRHRAGTIEAVYENRASNNFVIFSPDIRNAGPDNDQVVFGAYAGVYLMSNDLYGNNGTTYQGKTMTGNHTVSLSSEKGVDSLLTMQKSRPEYYAGNVVPIYRLGQSAGKYRFNGKLYGLRIYNRHLTEAEILQNQQYDIDTYFGGVAP